VSGYLLNLALRSAGIAPAVRSRPAAPSTDAGASTSAVESAHADTDGVSPAAVIAPAAEPAPAAPIQPSGALTAAASPSVAAPIASLPEPVVQRLTMSGAPAPSAVAALGVSPAPAPIAPATREIPSASRDVEPTSVSERVGTGPMPAASTAIVHDLEAPFPSSAPSDAPPPLAKMSSFVEPERHGIERVIDTHILEPATEAGSRPAIVAISPAPSANAAPLDRTTAAVNEPLERVVHVRIGAIEIHGAPAPLPAASAPPSAVAVDPVAALETGFDRFARLRSHAPWDR